MKKSTYALIGFLAFTMIASIATACILIRMSLSGDKVDRVEKSTETIGLTGKIAEFGTDNCSEIEFLNYGYAEYSDGRLVIDVVFDPQVQTPRIYIDSLWAAESRQEIDGDKLTIINRTTFDEYETSVINVKGKDGKTERVAITTISELSPEAHTFATIVLPAETGTVQKIDVNRFDTHVYGSMSPGIKINGENIEMCGDYDLSALTKQ